jgi:hypothetical protein
MRRPLLNWIAGARKEVFPGSSIFFRAELTSPFSILETLGLFLGLELFFLNILKRIFDYIEEDEVFIQIFS